MSQTVSQFIWDRLKEWGVHRIFGYPGDGINGLVGALDKKRDEFDFVQTRHEEMAAFMASAHAKFTGELGVCLATSGPGASHLLTGLYDARMDHMPVLAIVGQQARTAVGTHYQQELDLQSMFKDVAGEFTGYAATPAQVRHLVDRAVRIAMGRRRVTALIVPNDVQEMPMSDPPRSHGAVFSGVGYTRPKVVPTDADLRRAADVLNAGGKVGMLVGAGAIGAEDEVIALADKLGAGAAKALLGKQVLPDDLDWVTGSIGLLGTEPSDKMMKECDTFLMLGSGFPYSEFLPKEGNARGVQIDIDPGMLSIRYPMEVPLEGDLKASIQALLPLIEQKTDTKWRDKIAGWKRDWMETLHDRAMVKANPVNPQRIFTELSPRLPDRAIISSDSGSAANWYARDLMIRKGMMCSLSGGLASMGAGTPYAIAAKFAYQDRPVIACVGDGAMQMNNMAELITVAKYWEKWANPTFVVCVLNNEDLNQVTWEQRVMEGNPKSEMTQKLPDVAYHRFAQIIGLEGIFVDDPEKLGEAWETALAARKPCVLEVKTDPEVPPLPPHITFEQAKSFMFATVKGDPNEGSMIKGSLKQMAADFIGSE
ncbi:thiamine pyrophosphate-requiring protein [Novosphingobium malaysiense]|uniref:Thiamine pyrophosphate-binding protein n=1 Tax=Novosphingobium malaysiense TaxID=1348853 RepID=A0A0B1ZI09_9SPHN|nr:thiamine pyrophosphate-requiring protein [Novosphingobium malaysiense]KHK90727.1 thiamine pyrophosphate-binding protein [Novosphingobium malaysiense]